MVGIGCDKSEPIASLLVVTTGILVTALGEEVILTMAGDEVDVDEGVIDEPGAAGAAAKISSCAPGLNPLRRLYAGVCLSLVTTLLPVNWFHTIICFAPATHLEESSSHWAGACALATGMVEVAPGT